MRRSRHVKNLSATNRAFAALLHDGSVVTWGESFFGSDSSDWAELGVLFEGKSLWFLWGVKEMPDYGTFVIVCLVRMAIYLYYKILSDFAIL